MLHGKCNGPFRGWNGIGDLQFFPTIIIDEFQTKSAARFRVAALSFPPSNSTSWPDLDMAEKMLSKVIFSSNNGACK